MAYNIEYYHSYYDVRGTQHRIDLLAKDYSGGATAIQDGEGRQPVRIRHMQRSTNWEEVVIQGQELLFSFWVPRADADTFDALLESGYKDYRVDYYIDSELVFRGWIKPENITKDYLKNPPFLNIKLSATDALADLKDEDFLDSDGSPITGTYSELEILKYALSPIDIPLDFKIQLNTYEVNYMESDECPLEHINVDCRRFMATGADGRQEYKSCWEVIESILKKYNCNLKQIKGQYRITNYFEEDSYEYDYDWSTLTQDSSRASTDNILDISSYNVEHQIIQQKIRPLDKVGITFRNKDLGGDVTGMDLSDWANAAIWTIDFSDGYGVTGDMVTLSSDDNTYDDYIQTAVFDVASAAENEYFKITFYHRISAYTASWPLKSPTVEIEITRPDSSTQSVHFITREAWELYESPISPLLRVTATGNYQVALKFKQAAGPSNWDTADFQIQGMTISKVTISEDGDILEDVVFDEYYTLESDQGIETYEAEFIIADGGQITEVGAMLFEDSAEHITEGWSRYGGGEDSRLIDLYARNVLNNRYEYKDYLRGVGVFDPDHNIGFEKILTINGLNYIIMGYDLDCKNCFVTLNLIELVTVEQSSYGDITRSVLSTIDGKPATGSEAHVSGVPDHNDLDGIAGSADGYHLSSAQYANVGNLDSMAYEEAADYYTGEEINTWRNSVTETEMGYLHGVTSDIQGQLNTRITVSGTPANDQIAVFTNENTIEGTNNLVFYNGNLGVGIATPGELLYVKKAGTARATVEASTGDAAGFRFKNTEGDFGWFTNGDKVFLYDYADSRFIIAADGTGKVGINDSTPSYTLDVSGTGRFVQDLYGDSIIGHKDFVTGWSGTNWRVDSDGDAELRNLMVRGGLSVYELILNRLHYQDGGMIIGAGGGKIASTTGNAGSEVITCEDPEGNTNLPFTVGAIVMVQDFDMNRTTLIKKIVRQVQSINGSNITLTTTAGWLVGDDTGLLAAGDEIVAVGHISDTDLDSHIFMTATETDSPFIRISDVVDSWADFGADATTKVLIGNLHSLANYDILPASPGYGLYSDNVYLKGKIIASSGEVGGWTIGESTLYAGTEHAEDGFSTEGITLVDDGSFHSPNFYIDADDTIGIRAATIVYAYIEPSDVTDVMVHTTTSGTQISTVYYKVQTITLGSYVGLDRTLRIKFDIKSSNAMYYAYGRIYRNGEAVGTEQIRADDTYQTFSEDITGWNAGDTIELWVKNGAGSPEYTAYRNFKVTGTLAVAVNETDGASYS